MMPLHVHVHVHVHVDVDVKSDSVGCQHFNMNRCPMSWPDTYFTPLHIIILVL